MTRIITNRQNDFFTAETQSAQRIRRENRFLPRMYADKRGFFIPQTSNQKLFLL
jgi:hypothetical protein